MSENFKVEKCSDSPVLAGDSKREDNIEKAKQWCKNNGISLEWVDMDELLEFLANPAMGKMLRITRPR